MSFSSTDSEPFLEKPTLPKSNFNPAQIKTRFHKLLDTYHSTSAEIKQYLHDRRNRYSDRKISAFVSYALLVLFTSLLWFGVFALSKPSSPTSAFHAPWAAPLSTDPASLVPQSTYSSCGTSAATATVLGCKYDIGLNYWVPSACYDQFSIDEYKSDDTWRGYRYENQTGLLAESEMGWQKYYWTYKHDHVVHCAMLWKRQFRALTDGRKALDNTVVEQEHVTHCSKFLMKSEYEQEKGLDMKAIRVDVGFGGCYVRKEL